MAELPCCNRWEERVQSGKKISKPWKASSFVFVGSFALLSLHILSLYCTWAKSQWRRAWDVCFSFFLLKTFEITPKTDTSAQWDFLHGPRLFQHVFCPGDVLPHVRQFFRRWVIYLKVQFESNFSTFHLLHEQTWTGLILLLCAWEERVLIVDQRRRFGINSSFKYFKRFKRVKWKKLSERPQLSGAKLSLSHESIFIFLREDPK